MNLLIARLEMTKLFRHPISLGLIALTIGLLWLFFYRLLVDYLTLMQNALVQGSRHASLSLELIKPFFGWSLVVLSFILPLFTTFAFSSEFQNRTFYLWMTHEVRPMQLIIGKYLSLLAVTALVMCAMLLLCITLYIEASLDWGMIVGGCLAILGVASSLISFGLFISCIANFPLLAMGITVVGNMMWLLLEWLLPGIELSLLGHSFHLLHGYFQSVDLIFYLLFSGFWLFLGSRVLSYKMKRVPR